MRSAPIGTCAGYARPVRRFTRLTNAFSKKVEEPRLRRRAPHARLQVSRIHKTLRMAPAMAAGVTVRLWEIADLAKLLETA